LKRSLPDLSKTGDANSPDAELYTAADVGCIAQNVYLYRASEGLATVVRASIDKPALAKTLKLQPQQKTALAKHEPSAYIDFDEPRSKADCQRRELK
jgi:nitroreductase